MDRVFKNNKAALAVAQSAPLLTVIYLCDCSGSMAGSRIAAVNTALAKVLPELSTLSELYPQVSLQVGILSFANSARWHLAPTSLGELTWEPLVDASGLTALGAAYELLAAYLAELELPSSLPPLLVLLSDGMPTDDVNTALERLATHPLANRALRFAIGIGDEVDPLTLQAWVQAWRQQDYVESATNWSVNRATVANSAPELSALVSSITLEAVRTLLADANHE